MVHSPLVLAHASGFSWDEALLVMAPLVVIALLLWRANRRAARLGGDGGDHGHEGDGDLTSPDAGRARGASPGGAGGADPVTGGAGTATDPGPAGGPASRTGTEA